VDFRLGDTTIDVKTRSRRGYDLLVKPDLSDCRANIIVLAWAAQPGEVTLVGWIERDGIIGASQKREYRRGHPRLAVPARKLRSVEDLKSIA
jgi:hypothetical protein